VHGLISQRRIALALVDWALTQSSSGSYAAAVSSSLHAVLDPFIWTSLELITLPDTDGGAPIAALSVKTLPNGALGGAGSFCRKIGAHTVGFQLARVRE
jgi:hypothetical protein